MTCNNLVLLIELSLYWGNKTKLVKVRLKKCYKLGFVGLASVPQRSQEKGTKHFTYLLV